MVLIAGMIILYIGTCGGVLRTNATAQVLTSPNYPQYYPHNSQCQWVIDAPPLEQVEISITDINIEFHLTCARDRLEINDYPLVWNANHKHIYVILLTY